MKSINRRQFLQGTAATALTLSSACHQPQRVQGTKVRRDKQPNVVVIITDDQRWDCLSCEGHPFLKTPNMDRIANEGVRFANSFVTTSLCSPSRATMLSGLYAHAHQVVNNFTDYPANLPSYPRRLQEIGYETAYIGKWHMGEQSDEKRPGFDYWVSHKGQGKYFDNTFNINGKRELLKGYYTHRVTELANDFLKRSHNKPFMMIMGHKTPHCPFTPEPKYAHIYDHLKIKKPPTANDYGPDKPAWYKDRVRTWHGIDGPLFGCKTFDKFIRDYHASILSVDDSVGEIYETLRQTGELDNTLFIFTSDNGSLLGEHGATDKRTMHEESIRIPLLIRYPELINQSRVVNQMILNTDLAPSIIDICNARPLRNIHGHSFKPLAQGKHTPWRKSWHYAYNYEKEFPYTPNVRGVRTDEWKYVHYPNGDGTDQYMAELYNLKDNPQETKNLINHPAHADKVNELKTELQRLLASTGALPDKMPLNPQMKSELPEESIR